MAYLPAFAVVVLAEVRQLRLWTYYSVCGLLIGVWCNIIFVYDNVRNALSFGAFVNDPLMVFFHMLHFLELSRVSAIGGWLDVTQEHGMTPIR